MSYSYYRKRNPLQVIDKDNIVQSLPSTPFRSKNPNQQAKQEAVTVDMLDCDGQKHIAMIIHNSSTKRSFGNLFSPLRPAKGFKKSKQNAGPTSDEIVKDKLPSIPASSSTKHPRDADLVVDSEKENLSEGRRRKKSRRLTMTDHITRVLKVELGENGGNIYDSCPEVVDKVSVIWSMMCLHALPIVLSNIPGCLIFSFPHSSIHHNITYYRLRNFCKGKGSHYKCSQLRLTYMEIHSARSFKGRTKISAPTRVTKRLTSFLKRCAFWRKHQRL
jgi:hypothetical protein